MNIQGLKFDHPGTYVAVLRLNQLEAAGSPFNVVPMPGSPLVQF